MPRYPHLFTESIDFESLPLHVKAMRSLGVPYTDADHDTAAANAKAQAASIAQAIAQQGGPQNLDEKKVVALIAYVQRLGTDLFATPAETPAAPTTQPAGVASAAAAQ